MATLETSRLRPARNMSLRAGVVKRRVAASQ